MSQSSRCSWLKSHLRRNETKPLKNISQPKSLTYGAANGEQSAGDRVTAMSTATFKVSSIAALGVLNVVKAQAGAYSTRHMALRVAELLAYCTRCIAKKTAKYVQWSREWTEKNADPTKSGQPLYMSLSKVAPAVFNYVHHRNVVRILESTDRKIQDPKRPPHSKATATAVATAVADISYAMVDVVEAHITIAPIIALSDRSLENLILAVAAAAQQAAQAIADTVVFMDQRPSPLYEEF